MREILLDGGQWKSRADFFEALAEGLGSVEWHGRNADAFLETMIYHVDLNTVQPPYVLKILNASEEVRGYVAKFALWIEEARADRRSNAEWDGDVEVRMVVE